MKLLKLDQETFGKGTISTPTAQAMFRACPEIYSAVFDPEEQVAAYLDAYPLRPEMIQPLIDGDIAEADLGPEMLFAPFDGRGPWTVYVGSVVVSPGYDPLFKAALLGALLRLRVCQMRSLGVRRATLLMAIASKKGERLARRLSARKIRPGAKRKDGLDLYAIQISAWSLARVVSRTTTSALPAIPVDTHRPSFAA
jgi:hypothetical protein